MMIPEFTNGDKLMETIPFIVLDRYDINCDDVWFKKEPHIYVKESNIIDASSTHIRNELSMMYHMGLSSGFFPMINRNVFKYIIKHNLYGAWDG